MLDSPNMAALIASSSDDGKQGVKQQDITVNTAVSDTDYTWTVTFDDFVVTYTVNSGPGATTSSIAALIRAAIDNDTDNDGPGGVDAYIEEGAGAGAVAEVVGKVDGDLFVVASSDTNLTIGTATYAGIDTTEIQKMTDAVVGGVVSPAAWTGNVDDWDPFTPGDPETMLRVDAGAAGRTLSGIVPYHRTLILVNVTAAATFTISHEDANSVVAANRFSLTGAVNRVLAINEAVVLVYDPTSSRWRTAS